MGGLGSRISALLVCAGVVVAQEETGIMHHIPLASHEHAAHPNMSAEKVRRRIEEREGGGLRNMI